jgi:hypothetical protein
MIIYSKSLVLMIYDLQPTEMRSIRSGTESTRSAKRKKRPGINTAATPAQIFAQNLSDAVLDAEGSVLVSVSKYVVSAPLSTINPTSLRSVYTQTQMNMNHLYTATKQFPLLNLSTPT